ncbi:hypothetical protein A0O36_02664 [Piscirickettsiaceae bacterium NZ-RLO1]|nr:hypothetical protein A0O36_02664 [Piscirickettsiaceae bacterium NZ-RLO1]
MPCDEGSRGFIVVAFCSAILHHWMCKIPTEVATLTDSVNILGDGGEVAVSEKARFSLVAHFL